MAYRHVVALGRPGLASSRSQLRSAGYGSRSSSARTRQCEGLGSGLGCALTLAHVLRRGPVASATPRPGAVDSPAGVPGARSMGACTTMSCCFAKPAAIRERLSPVIRYSLSVRLQRLHPVDRVTAAVGLVGGGAICCMNRTSPAILGSTAVLCKIVRPLRSDRGQQAAREVVAADSEAERSGSGEAEARPDSVRAPGWSS